MVDQTRKAEKALHKGEAPRPSLHHKCRPMKSFKRSFSTLGEADSGSIEILTVLKRRSLVGMQVLFSGSNAEVVYSVGGMKLEKDSSTNRRYSTTLS